MPDGFIRVAAATPEIRVANCDFNAKQIITLIERANSENIRLVCMPELCITGSTCGDLFRQKALLESAQSALGDVLDKTAQSRVITIVGLPLSDNGNIYSAAVVFQAGRILGIVPKEVPYGNTIIFNGEEIPFAKNLIFQCKELPEFKFSIVFGENFPTISTPIIANLSASNEIVGSAERRHSFVTSQSKQLVCGYIYANAGRGESTTDTVFSGHNIICENSAILAESLPFADGFAVSEIDLHALTHDRRGGFDATPPIIFSTEIANDYPLYRKISPTPFSADCEEIQTIQAHGLAKRLKHIGAKAVLGISGGLDSTLALLATVRAYDILNMPKHEIIAVTMPCFGTTNRTKSNAHKLCEALGIPCREIDITASVEQHLRDIDHPENIYDTTFENAQARIRTLVLMDIANQSNGIVIGSGSLSELALGWATYNGDHMSMYGVNSGIPKTLVREIVRHAEKTANSPTLKSVLNDILSTPISPELLPPKNDEIVQQTEKSIGPYELHDFFIYHSLRWGRTPAQIFELACIAFSEEKKYTPDIIKKWQNVFYQRFFSQQFKRSCLPDGPQIFPISLSPRSGFRMPSDTELGPWNPVPHPANFLKKV
ncbi:MAG: NAD(+) synthase [Defluviitaleaceae bacterium]|nr:NAD(+) synthase [Defluviitaleaceae bacterium]